MKDYDSPLLMIFSSFEVTQLAIGLKWLAKAKCLNCPIFQIALLSLPPVINDAAIEEFQKKYNGSLTELSIHLGENCH